MKANEKEVLRNEYLKVWHNDKHMTDYCTNKTFNYAVLPDGSIIPIEKEGIQTRFCFGESGFDYDDAAAAAAYARKSEDYFMAENMKHFNSWLDDLKKALEIDGGYPDYVCMIHYRPYTAQPDNCKIASVTFTRLCTVLDMNGGSAAANELPGKYFDSYGMTVKVATAEEIKILIEKYTEAAAAHEKKIKSYLKRYGLSKVYSWTYWRDA